MRENTYQENANMRPIKFKSCFAILYVVSNCSPIILGFYAPAFLFKERCWMYVDILGSLKESTLVIAATLSILITKILTGEWSIAEAI